MSDIFDDLRPIFDRDPNANTGGLPFEVFDGDLHRNIFDVVNPTHNVITNAIDVAHTNVVVSRALDWFATNKYTGRMTSTGVGLALNSIPWWARLKESPGGLIIAVQAQGIITDFLLGYLTDDETYHELPDDYEEPQLPPSFPPGYDHNPPDEEEVTDPTDPIDPTDPADPTEPPSGYICPPCPSTDCYAPDNKPFLEEIIEKLEALQGGDSGGGDVDLTPILDKIEEVSNRVDTVEQTVETAYGSLNVLMEGIQTILNESFPPLAELLGVISEKVDEFVEGLTEKLEELLEVATDTFNLLNDDVTIQVDANGCNASDETQSFEIRGPRIAAIARSIPVLANVLNFHAQKVCEIDAVATVPEWWATRVGSDRPQAIVVFQPKKADGKWAKSTYPLSVPWAKNNQSRPSLSSYWKGPHYGRLTLPDNSQLVVNAKSQQEAERMIQQLKQTILPQMLEGSVERYGTNKGTSIKVQRVYPRYIHYYSTGQKSLGPDWIKEWD